jgi:hypothetical protein
MRQVWMNLLGNAVEFSSKKERPVIEVGYPPNAKCGARNAKLRNRKSSKRRASQRRACRLNTV